MKRTSAIKVFRSGETVASYNREDTIVSIGSGNGKIRIMFQLASAGGGTTDVKLEIEPVLFDRFCMEMREISPDYAVNTMVRHLYHQFNPEG